MADFLTGVSSVVTSIMTMFGSVATSLLGNNLFVLLIGILIINILFALIFLLIRKLKSDNSNPFEKLYPGKTDIGWKFDGNGDVPVSISARRNYLRTHGYKREAYHFTDDMIVDMLIPGLDNF